MKLKYQLLLLGLLSLLFPLVGWIALKSVDKEFRKGLELASFNTLHSIQASVFQFLKSNKNAQLNGLVTGEINDLEIDGYATEWNQLSPYKYQNKESKLSVKLANKSVLLISSNDTTYNQLDYVLIGIATKKDVFKYKIFRQAEGYVNNSNNNSKPPFKAFWHEKQSGYNLEIHFYNTTIKNIGIASGNYTASTYNMVGTIIHSSDELKLVPLVYLSQELSEFIKSITPTNSQLTLKDKQKRLIFKTSKLPSNKKTSAWQWIFTPIYQWIFSDKNNHSNHWFYRKEDGMAGISQSIDKQGVTYELKSMLPQGQQSMIQSLLKAGLLMFGVVVLLMFTYLLYSLVLAWRIKNLNHSLQSVLDDTGFVNTKMPSTTAADEIGQLSRGIEQMLIELRQYTVYLKNLGARLSHEMKTPIAIVQSSLENMELEKLDSVFLERAKSGTKRLKFILNQLSELSQLKHSLENTAKQPFNLTHLCQQLGLSYQQYIPQLKIDICQQECFIDGSQDLMAQLIDKLIENANDFTPIDGEITLTLIDKVKTITLDVSNSGSQLPTNQENIFDSLVSHRQTRDDEKAHLGLGLYMVKLIARYHHAQLRAQNKNTPQLVSFSLIFNKKS